MHNKLISIGVFVVGAAIGSVVTWKIVKTKYEQFAQEQIDSVKEVFARRIEKEKETTDEIEATTDEIEETNDYDDIIDEMEYNDSADIEKKGATVWDEIYVIAPDQVGDYDEYELVSLTYYADGVLTDSENNPILEEDIEDYVVPDFADHFGEYEDDSVFVRNEVMEIEYEILRDLRNYSDIVNK